MPGMDFNTWRQKAMQNAGRDWNERDAQNQYDMYQYRLENGIPGPTPGREGSGYSQGGADASGMRGYSQQQGMSEDFDRFDDATLAVWEKQKDSNCPPNRPYQAYDGSGCIEKPIDSNGGPGWGGQNVGGGGGGAGGQAGGYGGMESGFQSQNPLQQYLESMLGNQGSFMGEYDDVRGDGIPGIEGGGFGGGGVWWRPGDLSGPALTRNPVNPQPIPTGDRGPRDIMPDPRRYAGQSQSLMHQTAPAGGGLQAALATPAQIGQAPAQAGLGAVLPQAQATLPQYKGGMLEQMMQKRNKTGPSTAPMMGGQWFGGGL